MDSLTDMIQLGLANIWTYGVTFLFVLGLLVFVHEWGHYIVARLCGVKVDVFSVGFGKEIFGWTSRSGTRWKISLFPLGGYVKMYGDSDPASAGFSDDIILETGEKRTMSEAERSVAFFAKPVWKRALIVFAGPGINYLFAIIVLSILYMAVGRPITPPVVSGVEIGSAADHATLQPHDVIKTINGKSIDSFDDIRRKAMLTLNEEIVFGIERNGQAMEIRAIPDKITDTDRFGFTHERGYLGLIGPANGIDIAHITSVDNVDTKGDVAHTQKLLQQKLGQDIVISTVVQGTAGSDQSRIKINPPKELNKFEPQAAPDSKSKETIALILGEKPGDQVVKYNPIEAVGVAVGETYRITAETLKAIGQMFMGTRSTKELGGIIRIGAMAGDMAERGYISLIVFTALLSINLGMINLFPIPMLDGGHLMFYAIEAIRGKPISERAMEYAFRFGLVILVTLMVFSNLNDVLQLFVFSKG
ncbi:MAG TPA: RIP metalloprotease RseP [Rhodospirillaceae bacterium]|nr:RIP metalloprotease RseP [Rhodospirillaceae bacterium]